jgi:soluble lytic murein transglycosylase-like protein
MGIEKKLRVAICSVAMLLLHVAAFGQGVAGGCAVESTVTEASKAYGVPVKRIHDLLSLVQKKGYAAGVVLDGRVGAMAIPQEWLPVFEHMGIAAGAITNDTCQSILAGAWILAYQDLEASRPLNFAARSYQVSKTVRARRHQWMSVVERAARESGLPVALIDAVITAESAYVQSARSTAGAIGLMQLMPKTASLMGVNPYVGEENIMGGARYLAQLYAHFSGNLQLALAAYNAGPAAVTRSGYRIPAFAETQNYVPRVLGFYAAYLKG